MLEMLATISNPQIEATFKIFAAGTEWGSIVGTLSKQTDLQLVLDAKENVLSSTNKLNADYVDDTDTTNKFVTAEEIETWNAKQNAITSTNKLNADLVSDTTSTNQFVTITQINAWTSQGALADTALQPNANITELVNNAGYITKSVDDLTNYTTTTDLNTALSGKQDVISDLPTIRTGAMAGATALQSEQYGTIVINI